MRLRTESTGLGAPCAPPTGNPEPDSSQTHIQPEPAGTSQAWV